MRFGFFHVATLDGLDGAGRAAAIQKVPVVIEIWTGWTGHSIPEIKNKYRR
jgi:hypothetical protein